jgi:hypothetical protein
MDEKIDLSPLDPSRDRVRWERMVRSVAAQAAPHPVLLDLLRLARPALAIAAALAILAWVPALFSQREAGSLVEWASPSAAELLSLGGQ